MSHNLGDFPRALACFQKVVEYGEQYPSLPGAQALRSAARKDLVLAYARAGRPEMAWVFFKHVSGDKGADDSGTITLLSTLGETYVRNGSGQDAVRVYDSIASSHASAGACRTLLRVVPSLQQEASVPPTALAQLEARVRLACGTSP